MFRKKKKRLFVVLSLILTMLFSIVSTYAATGGTSGTTKISNNQSNWKSQYGGSVCDILAVNGKTGYSIWSLAGVPVDKEYSSILTTNTGHRETTVSNTAGYGYISAKTKEVIETTGDFLCYNLYSKKNPEVTYTGMKYYITDMDAFLAGQKSLQSKIKTDKYGSYVEVYAKLKVGTWKTAEKSSVYRDLKTNKNVKAFPMIAISPELNGGIPAIIISNVDFVNFGMHYYIEGTNTHVRIATRTTFHDIDGAQSVFLYDSMKLNKAVTTSNTSLGYYRQTSPSKYLQITDYVDVNADNANTPEAAVSVAYKTSAGTIGYASRTRADGARTGMWSFFGTLNKYLLEPKYVDDTPTKAVSDSNEKYAITNNLDSLQEEFTYSIFKDIPPGLSSTTISNIKSISLTDNIDACLDISSVKVYLVDPENKTEEDKTAEWNINIPANSTSDISSTAVAKTVTATNKTAASLQKYYSGGYSVNKRLRFDIKVKVSSHWNKQHNSKAHWDTSTATPKYKFENTATVKTTVGSQVYTKTTNKVTTYAPAAAYLRIRKVDATSKAGLSGATFNVGTAKTTGSDGWTKATPVKTAGTIKVTEISAPSGYSKDTKFYPSNSSGTLDTTSETTNLNVSFTASDILDGITKYYVATNTKTYFAIKKVDENGTALSGATFKVIDAQGNEVATSAYTSDGIYKFTGNFGPINYTLKETKSPDGYTKKEFPIRLYEGTKPNVDAGRIAIKMNTTGSDIGVLTDEKTIPLNIRKVNSLGNIINDKAKFSLTGPSNGSSKTVEKELTNGVATWDGLVAGGKYTLKETSAPTGYSLSTKVYNVNVSADGRSYEIDGTTISNSTAQYSITNTAKTGNFTITKVSSESSSTKIADAKFLLSGKALDGSNVEITATSGTNGTATFSNVPVPMSNYTLTEISAPSGYKKSADHTVTCDVSTMKFSVTHPSGEPSVCTGLQIADEPETDTSLGTIRAIKVDGANGKPLSGAKFKITGTSFAGQTINQDLVVGSDGVLQADLPRGVYTLKETQAPIGYTGSTKTYTIVVSGAMEVVAIPADAKAKGTSGGVTWFIDSSDQLVMFPTNGITGTFDDWGDMPPWFWDSSTITSVKIYEEVCLGPSGNFMFSDMLDLKTIDGLDNLNTANATAMTNMFSGCKALTSLDLSKFNTTNVTDMSGMFNGCSALSSLDVSKFNTAKVTNMGDMFNGCSALSSLDVSKFNTTNVTNMSGMFNGCSALSSLDVSKFNTTNVTNMSGIFNGCSALSSLDVSKFNTTNVTSMNGMFNGCSKLTELNLTSFDTTNVTSMAEMFKNCSALKTVYISRSWNTDKVTNSTNMFASCSNIKGGTGTTYTSSSVDKSMANNSGYLTLKDTVSVYYKGNLSGATFSNLPSTTTGTTSGITISSNSPTSTVSEKKYVFLGWNTASDGTGTWYDPGAAIKTTDASLTLYAQWYRVDDLVATVQTSVHSGDFKIISGMVGDMWSLGTPTSDNPGIRRLEIDANKTQKLTGTFSADSGYSLIGTVGWTTNNHNLYAYTNYMEEGQPTEDKAYEFNVRNYNHSASTMVGEASRVEGSRTAPELDILEVKNRAYDSTKVSMSADATITSLQNEIAGCYTIDDFKDSTDTATTSLVSVAANSSLDAGTLNPSVNGTVIGTLMYGGGSSNGNSSYNNVTIQKATTKQSTYPWESRATGETGVHNSSGEATNVQLLRDVKYLVNRTAGTATSPVYQSGATVAEKRLNTLNKIKADTEKLFGRENLNVERIKMASDLELTNDMTRNNLANKTLTDTATKKYIMPMGHEVSDSKIINFTHTFNTRESNASTHLIKGFLAMHLIPGRTGTGTNSYSCPAVTAYSYMLTVNKKLDESTITNDVSITYDSNAPTGSTVSGMPTATTGKASSRMKVASNTPTVSGGTGKYVFLGWSKTQNATFSNKWYDGGDVITPDSDVTLYAQWYRVDDLASKIYTSVHLSDFAINQYSLATGTLQATSTASNLTKTLSIPVTNTDNRTQLGVVGWSINGTGYIYPYRCYLSTANDKPIVAMGVRNYNHSNSQSGTAAVDVLSVKNNRNYTVASSYTTDEILTELQNEIDGCTRVSDFKITTTATNDNITIAPAGSNVQSFTSSKSGYKLLGVSRHNEWNATSSGANVGMTYPYRAYTNNGSSTGAFGIHNATKSGGDSAKIARNMSFAYAKNRTIGERTSPSFSDNYDTVGEQRFAAFQDLTNTASNLFTANNLAIEDVSTTMTPAASGTPYTAPLTSTAKKKYVMAVGYSSGPSTGIFLGYGFDDSNFYMKCVPGTKDGTSTRWSCSGTFTGKILTISNW